MIGKPNRMTVALRAALIATLLLGACIPLLAADSLADALKEGKPLVDVRYRWEFVDETGWDKDANASTIRARIGYQTARWHGLWAVAEYQGNFAVPASQRYNSLSNGLTQYPVVADPVDQEMGQAFLAYSFEEHGDIKAGLQRVNFVNQRYVGSVAWRQLEQVFSGATYKGNVWDKLAVHYAYLSRVVRVFGEHTPNTVLAPQSLNSHVLDVSYAFKPGTIHGYVHLFDMKDWAAYPSHKNLGLRFDGNVDLSEKVNLQYTGEYANQSDYEDSPPSFPASLDHDYWLLRAGVTVAGVTVRVGREMLGGDGTYSFQTPFATLHKFNGWADRFLTTPVDGLSDTYIDVGGSVAKIKLLARYHNFARDYGSEDYGTEWNFLAARKFGKLFGVGIKYAKYIAEVDQAGITSGSAIYNRDVDKFWLWLDLKL